jgi:hypothetical protein
MSKVKEQLVKLSFVPFTHQREAHKNRKRFTVLVWHRRGGKTVFSVMELLLSALACPLKNGRYAYIAPYYGQGKNAAWMYLKQYGAEIPGAIIREGDLAVILPNGAVVRIFGADNPDALRGAYFDGVVLDEVADMKPQIWEEVIRPALSDRQGWALFIGTPKGLNLFSKVYYEAVKDPEWFASMKRVGDTTALKPEEVEQARRTMAPPTFAQEYNCDFAAAATNAFIPLELVMEAQNRILNPHGYAYAAKVLGVDVARFGDDRSVIFPRQGLQGFIPYLYRSLDTQQMAGQVIHHLKKDEGDMAFIDEIGIGAGVSDRLRAVHCDKFIGVCSGNKAISPRYKNLRAEMADKVKKWLEAGGCLPKFDGLIDDFCAPFYWYDAADKLQIESKEQMKARGLPSCDIFDAFCLTFAYPVEKPSPGSNLMSGAHSVAQTDYDVFQ